MAFSNKKIQNKSVVNWSRLTFDARAKIVHKNSNQALKITTKMDLDAFTPLFRFYILQYICKPSLPTYKIQKNQYSVTDFQNILQKMGQKRENG